MVELDIQPGGRLVAVSAFGAQCVAMHVVGLMACEALWLCVPKSGLWFMAVAAGGLRMFTAQRKISVVVIKQLFVELDNACTAALVISMAVRTIIAPGVLEPPVEADPASAVTGHA